ncbi:dienelactone hydrolase family protein [Paraburkholderia silviterrae]|uniref:Dienelactone hydrolase family protein n=1 Tax=Paraburkholderia silviterrae TaxID=2528715 RepID=A0A4R5M6Q9_9BURK|nr:dienelactone hydrolase family protein [Paraburkholderia silviterrae]TDG21824.1 dienelactone hydrolase family protein [Paraburkholderia silviterrae]
MNTAQFPLGWHTVSQDGNIEAFCAGPTEGEHEAPRGTVLLLQEIFGVNAAIRTIATKLSEKGYRVVCADVFGHVERRVDLGYSEADRKRGFALMQAYDPETALDHCNTIAQWARHLPGSNGKLAVVGFCIGGLLALRYAARFPCDAAVSFYGVRVHEHLEELRAIDCPLQYHVGEEDTHILPEHRKIVAQAVSGMENATVFAYEGAKHGFFNPLREEAFNRDAFLAADERMLRLLAQSLR